MKRNLRLFIIFETVILLAVLVFVFGPQNLNENLIQGLIAEQDTSGEEIDLAIVLGAGVKTDGTISDLQKERVDYAVDFYKLSGVPLMFSGGETPYGIEALVMYNYAESQGYEGPDHIESSSTSTKENAFYSDILLDDAQFDTKELLVITSPYHSKRALATFKSLMPERNVTVSYPIDTVLLDDSPLGRLKGLKSLLREYLATIFYKYSLGIDSNPK